MGKLRVLSGQEVCKILAANGFVQVRQRGSHIIMQLKHYQKISVALTETLKIMKEIDEIIPE